METKPRISDRLWETALKAINQMEELELNEISVRTADNSLLIISKDPKDGDNLELIDVLELKEGKTPISYILYYVNDHEN